MQITCLPLYRSLLLHTEKKVIVNGFNDTGKVTIKNKEIKMKTQLCGMKEKRGTMKGRHKVVVIKSSDSVS